MPIRLTAYCFPLTAVLLLASAGHLEAQLQIRVGDSTRTLYSEVHEALREGSPAADSVRCILSGTRSGKLWSLARRALEGRWTGTPG